MHMCMCMLHVLCMCAVRKSRSTTTSHQMQRRGRPLEPDAACTGHSSQLSAGALPLLPTAGHRSQRHLACHTGRAVPQAAPDLSLSGVSMAKIFNHNLGGCGVY